MVWILPCHFDARHCHGTTIRSTKVVNIFNGTRRAGGCGYGYAGGGFNLGGLLGFTAASWLLNGLFNGFGRGNNGNYGNYGNNGGNGNYGGCSCGCNGANRLNKFRYNPWDFSLGRTSGTDDTQKVKGTEGVSPKVTTPGKIEGTADTSKGDDVITPEKKVGTVKIGETEHYDVKDIDTSENALTPEEAKKARINFWKSLGAIAPDEALEKAWNNNRLQLGKGKDGKIYVIYKDENDKKIPFQYDEKDECFKSLAGTPFQDDVNTKQYDDLIATPINNNEPKNKNMTANFETKGEYTVTNFDGRVKGNYYNCVSSGATFGSWLLNHNDESTAKVTNDDTIFTQMANGDENITFDEFIAYLSGYEQDAIKATEDRTDYGREGKYYDTVDMDAYDMVKLVRIFNKYAPDGNLTQDKLKELIKHMNQNNNSETIPLGDK